MQSIRKLINNITNPAQSDKTDTHAQKKHSETIPMVKQQKINEQTPQKTNSISAPVPVPKSTINKHHQQDLDILEEMMMKTGLEIQHINIRHTANRKRVPRYLRNRPHRILIPVVRVHDARMQEIQLLNNVSYRSH